MNHLTPFENTSDSGRHQWLRPGDTNSNASQPAFVDSELFIRQTFEADPRKGYELLFKRYYEPLCSHAVRFVYAKEVAEDLVIEVFGQFWQKQLQHVITTSYRAYLFTIVRHAAFAHLRKEFGREVPTEDFSEIVSDAAPSTPQQELQFNELYLKIEQVIRSLPPQSQKVFIMSRFEGKKNAMVADELQISVKTVEGHITKVLSILRQALREYGCVTALITFGFWTIEQGLKTLFSLSLATSSLYV
ncbi:RNA polymerase sigma-70 factor [Spirosoma sp. HMF3257]|uniref:RNA polymerase sigma-70 factor n=1 Tax=Spirosoma telluris TaxID=2183553 RepID=A0A327NLD3_9BACT|nr:RNA polymerase sigma-70 factor [Spirosoma telluris]RAI75583.1 RNA polymerase sigma-70 factor [Spirosoma telluris]